MSILYNISGFYQDAHAYHKYPCATLKNMKLMIFLGISIVGTIGGWIGASLDHGNWFGLWSILLSGVGSIVGVFIGYKIATYIDS
jgi:uncharacterized membrane protein YfcA